MDVVSLKPDHGGWRGKYVTLPLPQYFCWVASYSLLHFLSKVLKTVASDMWVCTELFGVQLEVQLDCMQAITGWIHRDLEIPFKLNSGRHWKHYTVRKYPPTNVSSWSVNVKECTLFSEPWQWRQMLRTSYMNGVCMDSIKKWIYTTAGSLY